MLIFYCFCLIFLFLISSYYLVTNIHKYYIYLCNISESLLHTISNLMITYIRCMTYTKRAYNKKSGYILKSNIKNSNFKKKVGSTQKSKYG